MKYYKNLIKRKQYGILIFYLFTFLLGLFVFYINFIDAIVDGFEQSGLSLSMAVHNGIMGLIGYSNIGMSLIGICLMYFGLMWPIANPCAQDDADYNIKSEGEYIHIYFLKYEFLVKKEIFSPTKLFFRDKNGHFVTVLRGYQVYNYVKAEYKELTEKELDKSKVILKSEVVDKFSNVKKMTKEEKMAFIKQRKLKDKPNIFFMFTSIILWISFGFWLLGLIFSRAFEIDIIIIVIISFILAKKSNKAMLKNKKLIKRILTEDMFNVDCKVYDKKITTASDNKGNKYDCYYIKITDGNYIVDQWIQISKEKYKQENNYDIKVYIFDKTGSDYFLI